ncbi:MAG: hypothetical protein IJO20_05680 [Ruminococcus sp.]|nr:hypothetical protein [Ruminococcus sp.]MBQ7133969.1 hypothetical protein [Ruminococcus sp.]
MTQIEDNITRLIKSIKQEEELSYYTFVKGFSATDHPNPMESYLIAVSTLDTKVTTEFLGDGVGKNLKGSIVNADLKFRVYAPKHDGGDGLLSLCCTLCDVIKRCDTNKVCEDVKVSGISFDNDANTVYRDVVASLSFCLCEEVTK